MWFSTTAWMMWNALVSTLLTGASIVMLDGNPLHPDLTEQWRLAADVEATMLGLSPAYVAACRKAGVDPSAVPGLRLRTLCTAGAPLPPDAARWLHDTLGDGTLVINGSGGTDVCSGIVQGNPLLPVWAGAISGRCLGVATAALDEAGEPVVGELGELVITEPMPSMPVGFWNDPAGDRYRETYFDRYPGVWRQGDWVQFSEDGSCVVTGRSDATLNRGGVRLGTGEFYRVVEELEGVANSLVVHLEDPEGGAGELILFVVVADGRELDNGLEAEIAGALRSVLSPRHVPDAIVEVESIPVGLTGKKLELPVKRILQGVSVDAVASRDALANPAALDAFVAYAASRRAGSE
jgi:acetoacetyl-CoA synthetase